MASSLPFGDTLEGSPKQAQHMLTRPKRQAAVAFRDALPATHAARFTSQSAPETKLW